MGIKKIAPALLIAVGLGLVTLTGCSSASTPTGESTTSTEQSQAPDEQTNEETGDQTVAEACATATALVQGVQSDLTSASTAASEGDFTAVSETIGTLHSTLVEAAETVGNPEVQTAVGTLAEKVGAFGALFDGVPDGDLAALGAKAQEITTVSQEVAEAGQAMSELCTAG